MHEIQLPSISRMIQIRKLYNKGLILRSLQYEYLSLVDTSGDLLDVGGGDLTAYISLLKCREYQSINIDPKIKPSFVCEVGEDFPYKNNKFDVSISLNTYEHVYDPDHLLNETYRVLKPKGRFFASTPFLYMIHGHPDDYFRPTKSWWEKKLLEKGFNNVSVTPLSWGPATSAHCASGINGLGKKMKLNLAILNDLCYTYLRSFNRLKLKQNLSSIPVGYFVSARKSN